MSIEVLDLNFQGRPQCVASFLIPTADRPLLVECGPATCRLQLLAELRSRGLQPRDLQALLVTHIHLDHAGDAGWWAQQGVPVVVHPLGAPHLIDPSKLLASAGRIYGEAMERLWGEILPCPEDKVRVAGLDQPLPLRGVEVTAWDSPGHARHHLAYQVGSDLLTGDVAGVKLPSQGGHSFLSVPAPPPEFEREVWMATIDKLSALPVDRLFLTHFGGHDHPQQHWKELRQRVDEVAEFVQRRLGMERDQLIEAYREWQRPEFPDQISFDRYEQANPLFMSVDGLLRYWKKRSA
ncbi:MBL fold metallo-hydrolase [bacterium]|nr:MBL fold metallo-hydrolase [bacterium]